MNGLEPIAKHYFVFNEKDSTAEQLILETTYYDNGDGIPKGIYTIQQLELNSYGNIASFTLSGNLFSPDNLRKLADELDEKRNSIIKR